MDNPLPVSLLDAAWTASYAAAGLGGPAFAYYLVQRGIKSADFKHEEAARKALRLHEESVARAAEAATRATEETRRQEMLLTHLNTYIQTLQARLDGNIAEVNSMRADYWQQRRLTEECERKNAALEFRLEKCERDLLARQ